MRLALITAPAYDIITLEEAKDHLKELSSLYDDYITTLIQTATAKLDGVSGILRRALVQQTWEARFSDWPAPGYSIRLPLPPLQSVTSIKYLDSDGAQQTLAESVYDVIGAGGYEQGHVCLAYNQSWPATRVRLENVIVRFVAGYPATSDSPPDYVANIPAPIKHAMKLLISHWFDNREAAADRRLYEVPESVYNLLSPYVKELF